MIAVILKAFQCLSAILGVFPFYYSPKNERFITSRNFIVYCLFLTFFHQILYILSEVKELKAFFENPSLNETMTLLEVLAWTTITSSYWMNFYFHLNQIIVILNRILKLEKSFDLSFGKDIFLRKLSVITVFMILYFILQIYYFTTVLGNSVQLYWLTSRSFACYYIVVSNFVFLSITLFELLVVIKLQSYLKQLIQKPFSLSLSDLVTAQFEIVDINESICSILGVTKLITLIGMKLIIADYMFESFFQLVRLTNGFEFIVFHQLFAYVINLGYFPFILFSFNYWNGLSDDVSIHVA